MEWIKMAWSWIVEHKDSILVTITSSQFITFVATLILNSRKNKKIESNTESNTVLNTQLKALNEQLNTITSMKKDIADLKSAISEIKETNIQTNENVDIVIGKVNAQLDAQSQVWSTIKDEDLKSTVTNIVTNAKYLENGNVVELRNKIEDLQKRLDVKTNEINKDIAQTVEQVHKVVKKSNNIQRV